MFNIAVIGMGLRARGVFGSLYDCEKNVRLVAVCDPRDREELRAEIEEMARILPGKRLSISCVGIDCSVSDERVREFCAICAEILK